MKIELIERNEAYSDAYVNDEYIGPVGQVPSGAWVNFSDNQEYVTAAAAALAEHGRLTNEQAMFRVHMAEQDGNLVVYQSWDLARYSPVYCITTAADYHGQVVASYERSGVMRILFANGSIATYPVA